MKVAVGADHKGVELKETVKRLLQQSGCTVVDFGTDNSVSVDYPDYGLKVARVVASGEVDRGITVCWTGNGMNIVANKVKGIRAGMAINAEMAHLTRLHNDANVLTLSAKYTDPDQLSDIITQFLQTEFEGGRHTARLDKIKAAESDCKPG
ncbi:MAG: ribose 5-phosphate isomerase B [Candidatus Zixiibacteriota bacterium]